MKRILSFLIALLLIGGGIFFYMKCYPVTQTTPTTLSSAPESPSTYERQKDEMQRTQTEDTDLYNNAIQSQDIRVCDAITNPEKKSECSDMIHASIAQKEGNAELCTKLSSSGASISCHDNITSSQAQKEKNKSLCTSISDESLLKYCKDTVDTILFKEKTEANTLTLEFCSTLETETGDSCRMLLRQRDSTALYRDALSSHILANCDKIQDSGLMINCRDALSLEQAIKSGDINLCNTISETQKKQFCITQLGKKNTNVDFASVVSSGNIAECQKLSSDRLKNQCHDMILISQVRASKDTSLCTTLTNTGMMNTCMQGAR